MLAFLAGPAASAAGALAGLWFVPFVVGLLAGLAVRFGRWRLQMTLPAVAAMAVIGWGAVLRRQAAGGEPIGATARVLVALTAAPAGGDQRKAAQRDAREDGRAAENLLRAGRVAENEDARRGTDEGLEVEEGSGNLG
jgi:hypothetical protein